MRIIFILLAFHASIVIAGPLEGRVDFPQWLALLHFDPESGTPVTLESSFYLSVVTASVDPKRELEVAHRRFFEENDAASICRFPARYVWLRGQLGYELAPDVEAVCAPIWGTARPQSIEEVQIAFPAAYVGAAASMFGHLFLVLEHDQYAKLLAPSLDFAAHVPGDADGMAYAWDGLAGNYSGYYQQKPLYLRLHDYNRLERRDVWIYPLNISAHERQQLAYHLYELRDVSFPYRFLSDNCGYRMLAVLDAITGTRLRQQAGFTTAPAEVLGHLDRADLLGNPSLWPSVPARMRATWATLAGHEREIVLEATRNALLPDPEWLVAHPDAAGLLYEFHQDRHLHARSSERDLKALVRYVPEREAWNAVAHDVRDPRFAQPYRKVELSLSRNEAEEKLSLKWSPGYHALTDSPMGYPEGYAVELLNFEFSASRSDTYRLEELRLLHIKNYVPFLRLDPRLSSRGGISFQRPLADGDLRMRGSAALGATADLGGLRLFGGLEFELDNGFSGEGRQLRAGPAIELVYQGRNVAMRVGGSHYRRVAGNHGKHTHAAAELAWYPQRRIGLVLGAEYEKDVVESRQVSMGFRVHY